MDFTKNQLVTVRLDDSNKSSNTYIVYGQVERTQDVILFHPLHQECKIIIQKDLLNNVQANPKDSTERLLDLSVRFNEYFDHNKRADLEALRLYFVINRTLTNSQKKQLSNSCGLIASIYFHNDVKLAMDFVNKNKGILDDFSTMWYNNFKDLFSGKKPVVSPKQRESIFNIAGSVLAELEISNYKK